jgi:MFS family permease
VLPRGCGEASTLDRSADDPYRTSIVDRRPLVRAVVRNRPLARALASGGASLVVEWSLWTAALVEAHERAGATGAGLVSIALIVPAALAAPLAGSLADAARPARTLMVVFAMQCACLVTSSVVARSGAPLVVVIVPIVAATMLATFVRPACSVIVPGLVATTSELTAANLVSGYVDNAAVLLGPLIAAGVLALAGPWLVFALGGALGATSAALVGPLARLEPPAVAQRCSARRPGRRVLSALVADRPTAALLLALSGQFVLVGGLDLFVVVLATDRLHLGASGPGALSACFGGGALIGGVLTTTFVGRRQLAPLIVAALGMVAAALVLLATLTVLPMAVLLLGVMGVGAAVIDVTGRMLLQRAAPQEVLASVFASLESLSLVGTAVGSLVVQILLAVAGIGAALAGLAAVLVLLVLATGRRVAVVDEHADAPVVAIRLLRTVPVFGALQPPELEGVARASEPVHVDEGETVIVAGERGDSYYVIARGGVDVFIHGGFVRSLGRGQGFGEIALLADVARTATVVARVPTELLEVRRRPFLTAVTGRDASRQVAWAVARSYGAAPVDVGERPIH